MEKLLCKTCMFVFVFVFDKMLETFISKVVKRRVMLTFVYLSVRACMCVLGVG